MKYSFVIIRMVC